MQDLLDLNLYTLFSDFLVPSEANSKNVVKDGELFHLGFNLKTKVFTVFLYVIDKYNLW